MRTDSISPRESLDAYETLTAVIDEIGNEMDAENSASPRQLLSQVHDRSALLVAGSASEMPPHCGVCKSFRGEVNECRRYAPFLRGMADQPRTAWPNVSPVDYCGEFERP